MFGSATTITNGVTLAANQLIAGTAGAPGALTVAGDLTLAAGAFTIANAAVTYAKMQAVSAVSRLLGSSTVTTAVQEIILGTNLSMVGTTLNAAGGSTAPGGTPGQIEFNNAGAFGGFTMSGDVSVNTSTGAATIAANAVTYAKMQAVAAVSRLLGSSAATTPVQEITLGTNLSMSGTTLNAASGSPALTLGTTTISGAGNATGNILSQAAGGLLAEITPAAGVTTFLTTPSSANLITAVTDETGTGSLVFANTPTLVTPVLGTPTSGTLTSCTGLPIATGVSGLAAGVAAFLAAPSSANLATAVTNETGSGFLVFSTAPTFTNTAQFGTVSAATGQLILANAGSAFTTTIQAGVNTTPSRTYTWPINFGAAGTVLTDAAGNGTLSWAAPSAGGTPATPLNSFQYNNASAFGGSNVFFESANVIAQRNSTTAQAAYFYNTFTNSSNYERAAIDWSTTANVLRIGVQIQGTGVGRDIAFDTQAVNNNFHFQKAGTSNIVLGRDAGTGGAGLFVDGSVNSNGIFWSSGVLPVPGAALNFASDAGLSRVAPGVLQVVNPGVVQGWIQWGGAARVSADFSVTSSAVLVNATGLSISVAAGRTYSFDVYLSCTCAAAGGVKAAIAGTATATNIIYDGWALDTNAIKGQANSAALGGTVASTVTTATAGVVIRIKEQSRCSPLEL